MINSFIIPIVLHKVVTGQCVEFEDINVSTLECILGRNPEQYITVEDCDKLRNVKKPRKMYMITFDDGFSSDYEVVFPLLKRLGIKATFFLNPINIGKPGFLTWAMIKEMRKDGMLFGSHGYSHLKMTELDECAALDEFVQSKNVIELNLKESISVFSFPYGCWNKKLSEVAKDAGYNYCFTSNHGIIGKLKHILPRNSINRSMSQDAIEKILNPSQFKILIWAMEDLIKVSIKRIVGDDLYKKIRYFFYI